MKELECKEDFIWHKKELDVFDKYEYHHKGEPNEYPCLVESELFDDPDGPYTYFHKFYYKTVVVCECCGNEVSKYLINDF